ncbi:hypothetical protein [Amycolatopsis cihanbeyliensis]|uniref:Glycosyltransferase RgtA/B/C/D-like domain-containing protein n=1 Tax=Amycolatopsis cihanbeyliensis TaxID=1128664 RepID=A0A542DMI6_AMYCI|nr:hypothetical protein [Amycolatopsis cihanbeyliensis]TQJ04195.1 hypothetical protein FB471_3977 [Amycolatopsis cihanbeyliensis]
MTAARPSRRLIIAGCLVGVFLVGTWAAWFFTIDDAWITFRYSANLADGHGPVWNPSGDPVEGFTNFAWMLWHAPFAWLGLDLPTVAKFTSFAIGLGILGMLLRAAHRAAGIPGALVAAGCYVLFLPTYFHITAGLETVAFAAVVLRSAIIGVRVLGGRPVRDWEPPVLVLVAGMLRPEGVLAALPAFGVWFWRARRRRAARWWVLGVLAAGAGYFLWRWSYYGYPLPNTFYVKFGNLGAGLTWVLETGPLFVPLILLTLSLLVRGTTRPVGGLLCAVVAATYLTYAVSGPSMDYLHRFAFHAFPVLCLGGGLALTGIARRGLVAGMAVVPLLWTAVAGATTAGLPVVANYGPDLRRAHVAIGEGLDVARVPDEFRTLAVSDAGAIPYYSGWRSVDYIGLNNEAIAHGADPTSLVRAARPTVLVVTSGTPRVPDAKYGLRVSEAAPGYAHVAAVHMRADYWQHVLVRPEWADQVRSAVGGTVHAAQRKYDPGRYELTIDRWLDRLRGQLPGL